MIASFLSLPWDQSDVEATTKSFDGKECTSETGRVRRVDWQSNWCLQSIKIIPILVQLECVPPRNLSSCLLDHSWDLHRRGCHRLRQVRRCRSDHCCRVQDKNWRTRSCGAAHSSARSFVVMTLVNSGSWKTSPSVARCESAAASSRYWPAQFCEACHLKTIACGRTKSFEIPKLESLLSGQSHVTLGSNRLHLQL